MIMQLMVVMGHTQLCMYNYTLYVIRKLCDVIIQKTKVCHGQLSYDALWWPKTNYALYNPNTHGYAPVIIHA